MDREMDVEMTPRIIRRFVFCRLRFVYLYMAMLLFAIFWSFVIQAKSDSPWSLDIYIMPMIMILIFSWAIFNSYRRSTMQFRRMKKPIIHYRFTDELLYVSSELSSAQSSWTVFKGLVKYPKIWGIVFFSGPILIFPVEQLDDELKEFLTAKLPSLTKPIWKRPFTIIATVLLLFIFLMYFLQYFHRG